MPSDCFTCCDIDWLIAGDAISARVAAAINANFFIGVFLELNVICPCATTMLQAVPPFPCCAAIISEQDRRRATTVRRRQRERLGRRDVAGHANKSFPRAQEELVISVVPAQAGTHNRRRL